MLGDLENEAVAVVRRLERVQDLREVSVELHVDDRADHLSYAPGGDACLEAAGHGLSSSSAQSASAPEMISISSLVIIA